MAVKVNLASLAKRPRGKRSVTFRDIVPPATLGTDLFAIYSAVLRTFPPYIARILAEYERTLSAMTTDSAQDIDSILGELQAELTRLVLTLRPALRDWAIKVEGWQRGKWRGAVLSATGVDLGTVMSVNDVVTTLDQSIAWNTALVKDVGAQAQKKIGDAVFAGLQNRTPPREVAKTISQATGIARDRSLRIASDQLTKTTSALADERRREAGLYAWSWLHSRKKHPRSEHVARDGNYYSDEPRMVGHEVDGKRLMAPPAENDRPGRQPYCGCRARAVMVWDDEDD